MGECTDVPMEQPILSKNLNRSSRWGQSILTREDVKLEQPENVPMGECTDVPIEQPNFELKFHSELTLGSINIDP